MASLRTFIAIKLDERIHRKLELVQCELRGAVPARSVRWVEPDDIHLTLKFLGDVPVARIEEIRRALEPAAGSVAPFAFDVVGLGCFPNTRRPNVVWVGVEEPAGRLAALQVAVETALSRLGFAREERAFSPHLTLGRVRREGRPADIAAVGEAVEKKKAGRIGRQDVSAITVFKSDLTPAGSVYTELAELRLGVESLNH